MHSSTELPYFSHQRLESIRRGQMAHVFHYQSPQQSALWLQVFRDHAPIVRDPATENLYVQVAHTVASQMNSGPVHLISLGCGEARKDYPLLKALQDQGRKVTWTPHDVSPSLIGEATRSTPSPGPDQVYPVIGDLAAMPDLSALLDSFAVEAPRIYTFYGLVPNFEPALLRTLWAQWLRPQDHLLVSANLAPVIDETKSSYLKATAAILPQYDNPATERWLTAILRDWGLKDRLGHYQMRIEAREELLRFSAGVTWLHEDHFTWEGQPLTMRAGESLQLFFSYRYTPARFRDLASQAGLDTCAEWLTPSQEEGVWWLRPQAVTAPPRS
jgi:L-histidine Nalpha-methyltransferase